jgi:hypothetical protein
MRGWPATSVSGDDGGVPGLLQLSDRSGGRDFDEADETNIRELAALIGEERGAAAGRALTVPPARAGDVRDRAPGESLSTARGRRAPRHHHDPDDFLVVERQAQGKVALIRDLARLTPASDLVRPGNDVPLDVLELWLRLLDGELLVSVRLLKHLPACCDPTKGRTWRHGFDVGIEQRFRCLEIMGGDGLDELTCAGGVHRRNLTPANTIFKLGGLGEGPRA